MFAVKLCEREFPSTEFKEYKASDGTTYKNTNSAISNKGNAYWVNYGTDGDSNDVLTPVFSFDSANFTPVQDSDDKYTGWTLKYVSNQGCKDGKRDDTSATPFVFTTTGVCDKSAKSATYSDHTADGCTAGVTITSAAGCVAVDGAAFFKAIEPYMGVIGILVGGLMAFAGAKFLPGLFAATIGVFVTVAFYAICNNLFFTLKTGTGIKVFVLIIALGLSVAASYFGYKFASNWAVSVVAALAGAMGFKLLLSLCGVMNDWAQLAAIILGAVAGAFIGRKVTYYVRTIGTAFLGSYILMRGCGFVFGGFPNSADDMKNIHAGNKVIYYFLGFIVVFIGGSVFQYKHFHALAM